MTDYARVVDGVVVELFTPPDGIDIAQCFVLEVELQFIPATPDVMVGWTHSGDGFAPPAPPVLSAADRATAALASGIEIVSSGTPAISGTYPLDALSQFKILSISAYISINGKFPGEMTVFSRLDTAKVPHVFPNPALFLVWATAVADYVAALEQIIETGSGTLPAQPTEIA